MEFERSNRESYKLIKVSKLLKDSPLQPNFQRLIDTNRAEIIYEKIKKIVKKGDEPFLPGCIIIVKSKETSWLIDGNHRMYAYKKLLENCNFDCDIVCNEINVKDINEAEIIFKITNNSIPIPFMPEGISLNKINKVADYFFSKYPRIFSFSKSGKCMKPHLHKNEFQEKLGELMDLVGNKYDDSEIIQKIESYNDTLKHKNWKYFTEKDDLSQQNNFHKAKDKGNFYLGLFDNYNWLFDLFNVTGYSRFKPIKKKIPKALRISVWNKYMGSNSRKGKCPLCDEREIRLEEFHCGHDMAEAIGGELSVDNLFPVCSLCNLSMGTKNFNDMWEKLKFS